MRGSSSLVCALSAPPSSSAAPAAFWCFVIFLLYLFIIIIISQPVLALFFFGLGYYLLAYLWFGHLVEAFVSRSVLVPLSSSVLASNSDSASSTSASFGCLLLFPSDGSYKFALICASFAFVTALCGPLRGPDHLFNPFPTLYMYFCIVLFHVGYVFGELTYFLVLGSSTLFLSDQKCEGSSIVTIFLIQLRKKNVQRRGFDQG